MCVHQLQVHVHQHTVPGCIVAVFHLTFPEGRTLDTDHTPAILAWCDLDPSASCSKVWCLYAQKAAPGSRTLSTVKPHTNACGLSVDNVRLRFVDCTTQPILLRWEDAHWVPIVDAKLQAAFGLVLYSVQCTPI